VSGLPPLFDSAHWQIRCFTTSEEGMMSRLVTLAMGAALVPGPALILAQDNRNNTNPANDPNATTGQVTSPSQDQNSNTNGQSTMPAATGQQTSTPQQQQNNNQNQNTMPATNGQATTPPQNNSTSGQGTVDQTQNQTTTGRGTVDQYNNGTTTGQGTINQNNATQAPATLAPVGGNYDNNVYRSTTGSANRSMPATAGGWLGMLLEGDLLGGAGLTLRRLIARR
jgi:hypothetical protein